MNFNTKPQHMLAAERYEQIAGKPKGYKRANLLMDLAAGDGENGNPALDWDRLLAADDFNFLHDIGGISRHIDRTTGVIGDFFTPRFTIREHDNA